MSEFMQPEVIETTMLLIEHYEDQVWVPNEAGMATDNALVVGEGKGFFARFSAPGYLDATDWVGPYVTQEGALWELYAIYDYVDLAWSDWLHKYEIWTKELAAMYDILAHSDFSAEFTEYHTPIPYIVRLNGGDEFSPGRYPYTYAYDYLRQDTEELAGKMLSRMFMSYITKIVSAHAGVEHLEICKSLANEFIKENF